MGLWRSQAKYLRCEKLTRSAKCEKLIVLNVKTTVMGKKLLNLNLCIVHIVRLL